MRSTASGKSVVGVQKRWPAPRLALRLAGLPLRLTGLPLCFTELPLCFSGRRSIVVCGRVARTGAQHRLREKRGRGSETVACPPARAALSRATTTLNRATAALFRAFSQVIASQAILPPVAHRLADMAHDVARPRATPGLLAAVTSKKRGTVKGRQEYATGVTNHRKSALPGAQTYPARANAAASLTRSVSGRTPV